jgi:DNA-binding MarR family transcriptional regulator
VQSLHLAGIYLNYAGIVMSRPAATTFTRHELLHKLWDLGRIMSTQTVFLHQTIAQSVGLNATDTKCIELILRGPNGSVTAGWLSDMTGLTTGAITHILDRLEKRRFVERVRDTHDRRKVLVRVRPERLEPLRPQYEAIGQAYMTLLQEYDDRELQLICDYLEKTSALSERELQRVILANRSRSPHMEDERGRHGKRKNTNKGSA